MTAEGILAGKAGFQKADLMDYGSLYGMGSYFGLGRSSRPRNAFGLMRLAKLTEENLAQSRFGTGFDALSVDRQAAARDATLRAFKRNPRPVIRGLHQIPIWDNRALRFKRGRLLQPVPTLDNRYRTAPSKR
jgi:nitric oxide reductase large subunit